MAQMTLDCEQPHPGGAPDLLPLPVDQHVDQHLDQHLDQHVDQHVERRARPRTDSPAGTAAELVDRLGLHLAQGDLTSAAAASRTLAPLLDRAGEDGAQAHLASGELAAALGEPEVALAHFRTAGERLPDAGPDVLPWRSGAALALLRTGEGRAAAATARQEVELATASGCARTLARALRTLAAVDIGTGRVQLLLRARAALADRTPDRLSAQIATDLAGLYSLSPDPDVRTRALALLREAEQQAVRQELRPLLGRIHRLLERFDEQPRPADDDLLGLLTPSERRVAQLAAEGLTNRQIAAELVVTVKAVEWHLSNVYRKLSISSRADLPASLAAA